MKIVCIGDSLTYGYGVRRKECWVKLLGDKLGVEAINRGVSGDTTAGILSRFYGHVIQNAPTHVIIMGGTNDFLQGHHLKNVIDSIELLIKESIENKIQPILAIQVPVYIEQAHKFWYPELNYATVNKDIMSYREWAIEFCSKSRIGCIDFYKIFDEGIKAGKGNELYLDGIHPTSEAQVIMADEFWMYLINHDTEEERKYL